MKFRYNSYSVAPSLIYPTGTIWRPELNVTVHGPAAHGTTIAMLDTGSDQTVLPLSVARKLGVRLESQQSCKAANFRGDITTIIPGEVQLEIHAVSESLIWTATVGFADFPNVDSECAVLGHTGCLEFFTVIFDGANRIFELRPNHCFPRKT